MKVIVINILIPLLIIVLIVSCDSNSLENCNCTQLKIYGSPSGILTPIRISKENLMESEAKVISVETITLLCPTRWTVRAKSLNSVMSNYTFD